MSSSEGEEAKPIKRSKQQITEIQRKARIENLRLGREKRMANIEHKKKKQAKKQKYEIEESESSSSSSEDSNSDEETTLISKKKIKKESSKKSKHNHTEDKVRKELKEMKEMILALAKQKKKKSHKTIVNIPSQHVQQPTNPCAEVYKRKLLDL